MSSIYSVMLVLAIWAASSYGFRFNPWFHHHHKDKNEVESTTEKVSTIGVADSTLVLTNVLFRHGNRTADLSELYPKDPYLNYSYYPLGNGQLTNAGKQKEYLIGQQLRERYDEFLGEYYYPDYLEAISTDYNRTKMSLELVLASLYIPRDEQVWADGFDWQPVPYAYKQKAVDHTLMGTECPQYQVAYDAMNEQADVQAEYNEYSSIFDYISENSGLNVTSYLDVYDLYFGLATEEEYRLTLPEWTNSVWPDNITEIAIKQYGMYTRTTELAQMASGYLLKKLISDAYDKINNADHGKRMILYSAHENNIGQMLVLLDIFFTKEIPTYGSYLIFELHNINSTYGFKIYYQNYKPNAVRLLTLPNCEEFCPLDKFESIVSEYIPEDDLCGN